MPFLGAGGNTRFHILFGMNCYEMGGCRVKRPCQYDHRLEKYLNIQD